MLLKDWKLTYFLHMQINLNHLEMIETFRNFFRRAIPEPEFEYQDFFIRIKSKSHIQQLDRVLLPELKKVLEDVIPEAEILEKESCITRKRRDLKIARLMITRFKDRCEGTWRKLTMITILHKPEIQKDESIIN